MRAFVILLIVLLILAIALLAYSYYFRYEPKVELLEKITVEYEVCEERNNQLLSDISEMEIRISELEATVEELSKEKEQKEAEIDTLKNTYEKLVEDLQVEIEDGQIKVTQLGNKLSVNLVDKILFKSGQAEITEKGLKVLKRVGDILKEAQDKKIRVEGHTDNAPIGRKLKDEFPTNWELSTTRATNVVRYLQEEVGVDPEKLEAVGMAQYEPVASNKTKAGRGKNRRIEIILVPFIQGM
jgi:chemotaxis protein MotB